MKPWPAVQDPINIRTRLVGEVIKYLETKE